MNIQTLHTEPKKATASLIIGIIGAFFLFLWIDNGRLLNTGIGKLVYHSFFSTFGLNVAVILFDFSFIWTFFLSICGVILGIKGLRSSKKFLAIFGLILCTLDLIFSLFCGYVAVTFFTFM
jgi:hypothetical protein